MKVFKFGGASVKDAQGVVNLGEIVKKNAEPGDVIIVSAMGKSTVALEDLAQKAISEEAYGADFDHLKNYHFEIIDELGLKETNRIDHFFDHLANTLSRTNTLSRPELWDAVMSVGELISTSIVSEYLKQEISNISWKDARELILTDENYNEAIVDWVITEKQIRHHLSDPNFIYITQGFIGKNTYDKTTTLGKEGSDFTAAIMAYCLDGKSVTIWKDVPGVLSADPKLMENARMFDHLSYQEAAEMTYYGAKVIHPKTIRPLAQKGIPLYVRSFLNHDLPGTEINAEEKEHRQVPSFIYKNDQVLVSFKARDLSFIDEKKLSLIFHTFDRLRVKLNMVQSSAVTLSAVFDFESSKVQELIRELSDHFEILYNDELNLLTVKNYDAHVLGSLKLSEVLLEQKSRLNFQVVYRK